MEPFSGMEAFVRVVETGSFTAAAEQLQTAKSSVSETVKALEDRLGVRLLDRSTRKLRVTEAGEIFFERCRRLIEEAEAARAEVQTTHDAQVGRIRLAAPEGFCQRYIVPCLHSFIQEFPGIEIELVEAQAFAKLIEERIDLAIRILEQPEETLVVRRIGLSRVVIVASPGYLASFGTPSAPEDLTRHRCIGFAPLSWRDSWRIGTSTVSVKPKILTNSTESLRAAALAGLGLTALPEWMVQDLLASGQLTRLFRSHELPASGIFAVYPTNRLIVPRVRVLVDHLVREFAERGLGS
jgi:DNA-binding transcriptional LysR family regulator